MKKLLYIFVLIFCVCAVGCGEKDYVVGNWQISQYAYSDSNSEYTYSIEQASAFVEKYITNGTQPENDKQQVEYMIAMLKSNTEGFVYNIKNDNTLEVSRGEQTGEIYSWERVENTLNLKVDEIEMKWYVDEEQQCCYYSNTFGGGTITVYLTKI